MEQRSNEWKFEDWIKKIDDSILDDSIYYFTCSSKIEADENG